MRYPIKKTEGVLLICISVFKVGSIVYTLLLMDQKYPNTEKMSKH